MKLELDESQERAVELMQSARVGAVTGGPGTGKTTCLRVALDRLDLRGVRYELAAPTGKAAKRIEEATGEQDDYRPVCAEKRRARTIHRLLEYHPDVGFRRNADKPIEADVILIDESSMIDVELAAALFCAVASDSRLILIGDANQLPSVGPGRVFGDLVDTKFVPLVCLTTLHRSAKESWIAVNAPRVLAGKMPDLTTRKDFRFIAVPEAKDTLRVVRQVVEIAPTEIKHSAAELQVLIPQRPGVAGIHAANRMLQGALNPRRDGESFLPRDDHELRVHDRVIQTRNNYELEVFNGEVGQIESIEPEAIAVDFGDRLVVYPLYQASELELAYALTVHRSQGSEFPWVIVVCHSAHTFILNRQLLYTAITRGKQGVILIGDEKGLKRALRTDAARRNTTLIERLHGELEPAFDPEARP